MIIVLTAGIIGNEYSCVFPRQAMKLYEEILFKSFIEKSDIIIRFIIFISLSTTESYYFITGVKPPLLIALTVYLLWYSLFQKQSIQIGSKNIIIGRKLFSNESVQSIYVEKNGILIEVVGQSFKIHNWIIGKQKKQLELVLKQITDKIQN